MDMWMDVDTALAEVPVNLMPLIDDTDFKTRETAVAYNAAGMDLVWNFTTTGGSTTQTAVTPTTGGVHDWAHQGDGIYTIEIPASGGTINNDTEGFGWFSGVCTGVLPWRGPVIGFRAAALNNALIDGGASLSVNLEDDAITAAKIAAGAIGSSEAPLLGDINTDVETIVGRVLGTLAAGTHNAQSGDAYARLGAPAGASIAADLVVIDNFVDDIESRIIGTIAAGTHNPQSGDAYARIGANGASLSSVPWNASWDAEVQSECTDALNAYDPPTNAEMTAAIPTAAANADAVWDEALSGHTTAGSAGLALSSASAPSAASIADAVWDEAIAGHAGAGSTGAALAAASAGGVDYGALADAVCDEALSGHTTAGTVGAALNGAATASALAVVDGIVDDILVDTGTTLPATLATIDGIVDAILVDTGTDIPAAIAALPTDADVNAACDSAIADAALATAANLAIVDSNVDAILVDTGTTLPASLASLPVAVRKNTALANFAFAMTDNVNHELATGLTVSCQRSIDGGTFSSGTLSGIAEVGSGVYNVDFAAADLNGDVIMLRCTASGADDALITLVTAK